MSKAKPMTTERRLENYGRKLTPAQRRRLVKKARRNDLPVLIPSVNA